MSFSSPSIPIYLEPGFNPNSLPDWESHAAVSVGFFRYFSSSCSWAGTSLYDFQILFAISTFTGFDPRSPYPRV